MGTKGSQDYVAPVTAHAVAAEHSKFKITNHMKNLDAYPRQLNSVKYLTGPLRVRESLYGHVHQIYK